MMLEALEFRLSYFQVGIQVIADILQSALYVENRLIPKYPPRIIAYPFLTGC